jgi:uncharacterized 2Fe-2S/4Fe-4S cluster protein (DUF4445 family)
MIQLAKSAICAGLLTLTESCRVPPEQIKTLYIAGGFGNFIRLKSAEKIRLFPKALCPKAKVIGNAALSGAAMLLMNKKLIPESEEFAKKAKSVNLSESAMFSEQYINGMMF